MQTLIRRRVLWRLIWVCTVCQLPFWGHPAWYGLIKDDVCKQLDRITPSIRSRGRFGQMRRMCQEVCSVSPAVAYKVYIHWSLEKTNFYRTRLPQNLLCDSIKYTELLVLSCKSLEIPLLLVVVLYCLILYAAVWMRAVKYSCVIKWYNDWSTEPHS